MKADREQRLYRIDRTALKILNGAVYSMFILAVLAVIPALFRWFGLHLSTLPGWAVCLTLYHYAWILCAITAGVCIVCRIALAPFVKSEEQEEFEQKVEYVLQQKKMTPPQATSDDYSPLCDLTPEQEQRVIRLLHDLPGNPNKPTAINLALIARYLTALEQMGKANLTDKHALRIWVMNITDKDVPSSSQFNEAVPNTNRKELAQLREQWTHLLCDSQTK